MTNRDLLQRAAKALRETHPTEHDAATFTRARILRTLHEQRRKRLTRWLVLSPLAAILLGGTAWAQATGHWPLVWQEAKEWLSLGETPTVPVPAPSTSGRKPSASSPKPEKPDSEIPPDVDDPSEHEPEARPTTEQDEPSKDVTLTSPDQAEPKVVHAPRLHSKVEPPLITLPSSGPGSSSSNVVDSELALFREAHDLHFKQSNPSAALAAYARYLDRYPNGRFVPEARYNTALNLLKTGQKARATALLEPFARGDYGGYRQQEAAALLDTNRRERL